KEARANVAIAGAELVAARLDLEFTSITAPIAGRISATEVDIGNLVIGGPSGATVLANIVSVDPIEFAFTVSEADLLRYARLDRSGERPSSRGYGTPVQVRLIGDEDWPWEGVMTFVDNQIDPNSGTMEGRATLANPDWLLQPGLFGRLRLPSSGEYQAMLVPDEAIVADQSRLIVYVVGEGNMVEERAVEVGPLHRGLRVIKEGLTPEDLTVVSGVQRARPGAPVEPIEAEIAMDEAE
ncbi:MAG: efflux RND transporter periplasmic adaptor subunit, partial [Geminicoccaceae bacterium]